MMRATRVNTGLLVLVLLLPMMVSCSEMNSRVRISLSVSKISRSSGKISYGDSESETVFGKYNSLDSFECSQYETNDETDIIVSSTPNYGSNILSSELVKGNHLKSDETAIPKTNRNIEDEISEIKSDLDQLLKFNENLLHFDKSIVNQAAKTKVEQLLRSISDPPLLQTETTEATAKILRATAGLGRSLHSLLDSEEQMEIVASDVSMMVMKDRLADWESEGVRVETRDNVSLSLVRVSHAAQSPILAVDIIRASDPPSPLKVLLSHPPGEANTCSYWSLSKSQWSQDGCLTLRNESSSTRTVCKCNQKATILAVVNQDVHKTVQSTTTTSTTTPSPSISKNKWHDLLYFSAQPTVTENIIIQEKETSKFDSNKKASSSISSRATVAVRSSPAPAVKTDQTLTPDEEYKNFTEGSPEESLKILEGNTNISISQSNQSLNVQENIIEVLHHNNPRTLTIVTVSIILISSSLVFISVMALILKLYKKKKSDSFGTLSSVSSLFTDSEESQSTTEELDGSDYFLSSLEELEFTV